MSPPFAFLGLIQGYGNIDSDLKPNSYQYIIVVTCPVVWTDASFAGTRISVASAPVRPFCVMPWAVVD